MLQGPRVFDAKSQLSKLLRQGQDGFEEGVRVLKKSVQNAQPKLPHLLRQWVILNKGEKKRRKEMKIFSFDAETNGLWGQAFAISAAVYEDGKLVADFTAYLGADGVTDEWVRGNVLPNLGDLVQTHSSYDEMLAAFAEFYKANKADADIIVHMGVPVESRVLSDMHSGGHIGDWDGPFPLIDVASVLKARGEDPASVDSYNEKHRLMSGRSEAEGLATHHPLYDSVAAAVVYMHLMG